MIEWEWIRGNNFSKALPEGRFESANNRNWRKWVKWNSYGERQQHWAAYSFLVLSAFKNCWTYKCSFPAMKDYFPLFSLWLRRVESEHNHLYFSQGPLLTFVIHCYNVWAGASQKIYIYIYQISIYIYILKNLFYIIGTKHSKLTFCSTRTLRSQLMGHPVLGAPSPWVCLPKNIVVAIRNWSVFSLEVVQVLGNIWGPKF